MCVLGIFNPLAFSLPILTPSLPINTESISMFYVYRTQLSCVHLSDFSLSIHLQRPQINPPTQDLCLYKTQHPLQSAEQIISQAQVRTQFARQHTRTIPHFRSPIHTALRVASTMAALLILITPCLALMPPLITPAISILVVLALAITLILIIALLFLQTWTTRHRMSSMFLWGYPSTTEPIGQRSRFGQLACSKFKKDVTVAHSLKLDRHDFRNLELASAASYGYTAWRSDLDT